MSRLPAPENPVPDIETVDYDGKSVESPDEPTSSVVPVAQINKAEPVVTRKELWSYYSTPPWYFIHHKVLNVNFPVYYNGDNGVGPNGYSMTLFQSLAFAAGYDPSRGPGSSCSDEGASGRCVVPWAGGHKSVSSVVLVGSGVSFAAMTLIFTTVGSAADYGGFGRWVLFVFTVVCWAAQYASMSLTSKSL